MNTNDDPHRLATDLIAGIAQGLSLTPLAAPRRAALRARVLAATTASATMPNAPLMHVVRAGQGIWLDLLPGVSIKFLRVDAATCSQSSLWRLAPGARVPAHPHDAEEECIVLEGGVRFGGHDYARGDYLLARPGLEHEEFTCPDGALLYIRGALSEPLAALARRDDWLS